VESEGESVGGGCEWVDGRCSNEFVRKGISSAGIYCNAPCGTDKGKLSLSLDFKQKDEIQTGNECELFLRLVSYKVKYKV